MERHKIVHLNSVLKCNNKPVSSKLSFSEDIEVVSKVFILAVVTVWSMCIYKISLLKEGDWRIFIIILK